MPRSDNGPKVVAALMLGILITTAVITLVCTQPNCPKSQQKTIHVPAVKGETEMDSYEAYDYVVCEVPTVK